MLRVGYQSYVYKLPVSDQVQSEASAPSVGELSNPQRDCVSDIKVEAGSDAPSEAKVDQRAALPAENGLSHTPIIAPKPPSLLAHQPQSAGTAERHNLTQLKCHFHSAPHGIFFFS